MAKAVQIFDHDTPSAPTLSAGALLGASGITHPPLQTLGVLSGTSTADGSFSDTAGFGQVDYGSDGSMYVADYLQNRIQRFTYSDGSWSVHSKATGLHTVMGGGTTTNLMAIDRSRNEIHIAQSDRYVSTEYIWVWSLASWPTLTALNVVRKYGANASTNTVGHARTAISLSVDDTHAMVSSGSGSGRNLVWNHVTGALVADESVAATYSQPCNDGAGNWWRCGDSNLGTQKISPTTLAVLASLMSGTANAWRPNRMFSANGGPVVYYNGRVYTRDHHGRIIGHTASTGAYVDTFIQPGSLEAANVLAGASGANQTSAQAYRNKMGVVVAPDGGAWLAKWENGSDNGGSNAFLSMHPIGASVATWTKTDWSAGVNTLQSIFVAGLHLSGEKYKLRLRKNAGSWITFTTEDARNSAFFDSLGTFTTGDTLTVELSLSTWDRLDFAASLVATRDKLSPVNISVQLDYEDSVADVYVPYPSGELEGEIEVGAELIGEIET